MNKHIPEIKTLAFDLETMPNLVRTWRKWEQNVIWYERHGYIWSISYSYLGSDKIYHKNITDFPLYKKDKYSDEALVKFICKLVNECHGVLAHNGNAFDIKTITGRFVHYRLPPPRPYFQIDTKVLYKKYLNEDSNSLKDIALKHGLPLKLETGGEKLWELCEQGHRPSINKMKEYNNHDVVVLKAAYYLILPYATSHPNIAMLMGLREACPNCGSKNMIKNGLLPRTSGDSWQQWICKDCKSWHKSPQKKDSQIR